VRFVVGVSEVGIATNVLTQIRKGLSASSTGFIIVYCPRAHRWVRRGRCRPLLAVGATAVFAGVDRDPIVSCLGPFGFDPVNSHLLLSWRHQLAVNLE